MILISSAAQLQYAIGGRSQRERDLLIRGSSDVFLLAVTLQQLAYN